MRRSAAPSYQSSAKRLKFLSTLQNPTSEIDEDNDLLNYMEPEIAQEFNMLSSRESKPLNDKPHVISEQKEKTHLRSTSEALQLILGTTNDDENLEPEEVSISLPPVVNSNLKSCNANFDNRSAVQQKSLQSQNMPEKINDAHVEEDAKIGSIVSDSEITVSRYNVMWCKRSAKKHKIWEGDGVLTVRNRSAVLKDSEGKEIDRGIGYKLKDVSALEEGSKFYIGGKECEIQDLISSEICTKERHPQIPDSSSLLMKPQQTTLKNIKRVKPSNSIHFISPFTIQEYQKTCDTNEHELILPCPTKEHQKMYNKINLPVTDVKVDTFLTKLLRPHQKEGIIFMYKCIIGFQHDFGQGVILADEMGLGKTLQCIALIWTLFKQGPYGGRPVLKRVIIITPSSLVTNWKKEFHKWLGSSRLSIFVVDKKNTPKDFIKTPKDILIISYEMFLRSAALLSSVSFDLVICDEGHRIKNLNIKISNVINCLSTTRRILLTGTPIQNDLAEFFSIVDFANPGTLGSIKSFRTSFEKPILQSRNQDCTEEEREVGEEKSEELANIVGLFMLRRTQEVINQYLPPKSETVIFCRPSQLQRKLYESLLGSRFVERIFSSSSCIDSSLQLVYISMLRKLCNHPALLYNQNSSKEKDKIDCIETAFPPNYQPLSCDSGKMKVLENMLSLLFSAQRKEKVVIVSCFTKTLNLIENLCKEKGYFTLRLDGSTASASRLDIVDVFNRSYTKYNVFLLSSKAGGVGLNLIGASRIVLYDIDWNPANDLQAMARIWRDGQKHSVYVYRLLTTGTIEEKIYQRQLSKQCLSETILNTNVNEKLKFTQDELKDLFTFHENTDCLTHDLINCQCLNLENCNVNSKASEVNNSKSLQHNIGMEELMKWQHICGPISHDNVKDLMLASGGYDITFLLTNKVNTTSVK